MDLEALSHAHLFRVGLFPPGRQGLPAQLFQGAAQLLQGGQGNGPGLIEKGPVLHGRPAAGQQGNLAAEKSPQPCQLAAQMGV